MAGSTTRFGTNRAESGRRSRIRRSSSATQLVQHRGLRAAGGRQLGNLGRNTLRGPGVNNLDLALFKNFELGHGMRLQFRLESFNAFNHTQFSGVSTNLTSPTSAW